MMFWQALYFQPNRVQWHPHRPFVAAVGVENGHIYIWSILTPQRWSALAPDFIEVEENVEYVEREDEFDIQPPEELHKRRLDLEDEEVDVLSIAPVKGAEFQPGEFRMPVLLDVDGSGSDDEVVAVGTGQYRKKTPSQDWMNGVDTPASGDDTKKPVAGSRRGVQNGTKRRRGD
jgi:COMPASS component SWD1